MKGDPDESRCNRVRKLAWAGGWVGLPPSMCYARGKASLRSGSCRYGLQDIPAIGRDGGGGQTLHITALDCTRLGCFAQKPD